MALRSLRRNSPRSTAPSMSRAKGAVPATNSFGEASVAYLKTLQRQHRITIRKLDNIQRELDAASGESSMERSSLVDWFLRMMGH